MFYLRYLQGPRSPHDLVCYLYGASTRVSARIGPLNNTFHPGIWGEERVRESGQDVREGDRTWCRPRCCCAIRAKNETTAGFSQNPGLNFAGQCLFRPFRLNNLRVYILQFYTITQTLRAPGGLIVLRAKINPCDWTTKPPYCACISA